MHLICSWLFTAKNDLPFKYLVGVKIVYVSTYTTLYYNHE